MTEIIVKTAETAKRHMIDPVAFFGALIAAPLLVALCGFWLFLIPVAALAFGLPVYLATMIPLMLWWLGRHEVNSVEIAFIGFLSNAGFCLLILISDGFTSRWDSDGMAGLYFVFGSFFAPVWAGVFAALYVRWRRDFYTRII